MWHLKHLPCRKFHIRLKTLSSNYCLVFTEQQWLIAETSFYRQFKANARWNEASFGQCAYAQFAKNFYHKIELVDSASLRPKRKLWTNDWTKLSWLNFAKKKCSNAATLSYLKIFLGFTLLIKHSLCAFRQVNEKKRY